MSAREDFDAFVAARMPALLRTAYLLTGHAQDAEDLVQTALVRAVPAWKRIAGNPDAYLRRIMVNENISRWRRHRGRELVTEVPEGGHHDPSVAELVDLRRALAGLAPRQRAVIVLRYYEDLTERETADAMGISIGTVKSQTRDAMVRLRTLLPELDAAPEPEPSPQ